MDNEKLTIVAEGEDARVMPGVYVIDLMRGLVESCPMTEGVDCEAIYACCCSAASPNGVDNLPGGKVVGFACAFNEERLPHIVNPATFAVIGKGESGDG